MAKFLDKDGLTYFYNQLKNEIPDEGITVLTGTSTNPINANDIKEVGIYIIEGNRINFPNDTTLKQIMQVSYSNTVPNILPTRNRLLQTLVLYEGIYTRTIFEQYPIGSGGPSYTYTNWIIQNKEVGYEDDLQGTETIIIEDSDFEGIDGAIINEIISGDGYIKYPDGTMICYGTSTVSSPSLSDYYSFCKRTNLNTVTFPQEFISTPSITIQNKDFGSFSSTISSSSTTDFSYYCFTYPSATSSSGIVATIDYMAIGKWK